MYQIVSINGLIYRLYRTVFTEPRYIDYHYPFQTINSIYRLPQEFDGGCKLVLFQSITRQMSVFSHFQIPWHINFQLTRITCFVKTIIKSNRTKVGLNALSNRLHSINSLIPLDWLNLSIESREGVIIDHYVIVIFPLGRFY